jgi:Spy/CpxP family protein refolding chaperone
MIKSAMLAIVAAAVVAPALAADAPPAKPAATPQQETEQLLTEVRNDLQAKRADIVAKGLTLTADQAAKFWPLFEQFQTEQNAVIDAQLKATQKYADSYAKLTDADSLAYVNALLERDQKIHDIRVKWLAKFQTVLPPGTAARAIHIDRRLGLLSQLAIASKIPLVR